MIPAIEVDQLCKKYGKITAVNNLSFKIFKGEIVGFLGPNGAGKTTTLRLLSGFLKPDSGVAKLTGLDVNLDTLDVQKNLGYLPESLQEVPDITVEEFVTMVAKVHALPNAKEEVEAALTLTKALPLKKRLFETLSKGQKQRAYLAAALIHKPDVLILDEPTEGLDPNQKADLLASLKEISRNCAILFSTHILEDVEAVCTRCLLLNKGELVADWQAEELEKNKSNLKTAFAELTEDKEVD